jgi:hypothetical protein
MSRIGGKKATQEDCVDYYWCGGDRTSPADCSHKLSELLNKNVLAHQLSLRYVINI